MPQFDVFSLTFRAGLHIGLHGIGQERVQAHIPSDTLFAALVSIRQYCRGDAGSWAKAFQTVPPYRLTSAFPFAGGVRFFPRPLHQPERIDPKVWRKIRFVSGEILKLLQEPPPDFPKDYLPSKPGGEAKNGLTLQGGALWMSRTEIEQLPAAMRTKKEKSGTVKSIPPRAVQRQKVWGQISVPRVSVDRITNAPNIFHTGRIVFSPDCGLWFGVAGLNALDRAELLQMLQILGDSGLGAERSVGYGVFSTHAESDPLVLPDARANGKMMLLSRFYPRDDADAGALTTEGSAYDLTYVAGRVQTPGVANQRRRGVRLVSEGSIIANFAQGGLADVKPTVSDFPHPVYRYGLAVGTGMEVDNA